MSSRALWREGGTWRPNVRLPCGPLHMSLASTIPGSPPGSSAGSISTQELGGDSHGVGSGTSATLPPPTASSASGPVAYRYRAQAGWQCIGVGRKASGWVHRSGPSEAPLRRCHPGGWVATERSPCRRWRLMAECHSPCASRKLRGYRLRDRRRPTPTVFEFQPFNLSPCSASGPAMQLV